MPPRRRGRKAGKNGEGGFAEEPHEHFEEKRFERHEVVHEGIDQALTADGERPKERRTLRLGKVSRDLTEVESFEGGWPAAGYRHFRDRQLVLVFHEELAHPRGAEQHRKEFENLQFLNVRGKKVTELSSAKMKKFVKKPSTKIFLKYVTVLYRLTNSITAIVNYPLPTRNTTTASDNRKVTTECKYLKKSGTEAE
jgi:hypothetical protein